MNPDEQRSLIDRYIAAYNAFDIEGMLDTVHPDVEFKNVSGDQVNAATSNADEFRELALQTKGLFSSRCQTVNTFESSGDGAVVEIAYEAVLAADLPNGMKAGTTIRLDGRSEFVFRDGRIYRLTDYS